MYEALEQQLQNGPLAHGYLVLCPGGGAEGREALTVLLKEASGEPELFVYDAPIFGIKEAHEARRRAQLGSATKKFFLIAPSERLTLDAQHALLKISEEPPVRTHFFLYVSTPNALLPTLRSRLREIRAEAAPTLPAAREEEIYTFLSQGPAARLKLVGAKAVDRTWAAALLRDVEIFLSAHKDVRQDENWQEALRVLVRMQQELQRPAAASRMIAEYVALQLPELRER
jgi:DNA polymerase III delta prime subunit